MLCVLLGVLQNIGQSWWQCKILDRTHALTSSDFILEAK